MDIKRYVFIAVSLVIAVMGCSKEQKAQQEKTLPSSSTEKSSVVAPGAKIEKCAGGFTFAEGPAVDADGNIFFIDIPPNRIHRWSLDSKLTTFTEVSGGANGLYFDKKGNLLVCAWRGHKVVSIDPQGTVTVLADNYNNKPLKSPNDLWVDPKGGIYFTDAYNDTEQNGNYVYYLTPDRKELIWMKEVNYKPNGVIGTPDGKLLYVIKYHSETTYVYNINADGTLSNKKFFAPAGDDGLTVDSEGNVYLTNNQKRSIIEVYDSTGNKIDTIDVPEPPANVCFGGKDKQTLFITALTSLYSLRMSVKGI